MYSQLTSSPGFDPSQAEVSPAPAQAGSELQQQPCQVSSPTTGYPLEYVYPKVSASNPCSEDCTGETGEDSGYGQGCASYVPSQEALDRECMTVIYT